MEQRAFAVDAADERAVAHAGHGDAGEPLVQGFQIRFQCGEIEPRRAVCRDPEVAPRDLAAKGGALKIEEPGRALQIGESFGIGLHQPDKIRLGGRLEPQQVQEGDIVLLQDAKQVVNVTPGIIDELGAGLGSAAQEYATHASAHRGGGLRPNPPVKSARGHIATRSAFSAPRPLWHVSLR